MTGFTRLPSALGHIVFAVLIGTAAVALAAPAVARPPDAAAPALAAHGKGYDFEAIANR